MNILEHLDLLKGFEPFPHVAVAVSGGPDSMALAHSLNQWAECRHAKVTALIVDHTLRTDSTQEAFQVASWLRGFNIPSHILTWQGPVPQTRIQEKARQMRYKLLSQWCHTEGVLHLFLGHHQNDQHETRLMRLMRGSHLRGLQGMKTIHYQRFGRILRPFLEIKKADLLTYCHTYQVPYVIDPSNRAPYFLRTHLRTLLEKYISDFPLPSHNFGTCLEDWLGRFLWYHSRTLLRDKKVTVLCQKIKGLPDFFQGELLNFLMNVWGGEKFYPYRRSTVHYIQTRFLKGQVTHLKDLEISERKGTLKITSNLR